MKEVYASMAGTVLTVLVNNGEDVTEGQTVIMLESMKMEIPVDASEPGKISEVKVNIGDFVNEGDVLVILE